MDKDLKDIAKELLSVMREEGCEHLVIRDGDFEIEIERSGALKGTAPTKGQQQAVAENVVEKEDDGKYIRSPVVGTYFCALDPKAPPCIKAGDRVEPDTVVGIVEAMKVMNEVKAGVSGTIAEIMVDNGHPVEYDTKICRLL